MKNQIIYNAPRLGEGQFWRIHKYLLGDKLMKCPREFSEFSTMQYIGYSNGFYNFLGDGAKVIVCTIQVKVEK